MRKMILLITIAALAGSCQPPGADPKMDKEQQQNFERYQSLQDMRLMLMEMQLLTEHWVLQQGESAEKRELKKMLDSDCPALRKRLEAMKPLMNQKDQEKLSHLFTLLDSSFIKIRAMMESLSDFANYEDPAVMFPIRAAVIDNDGELLTAFRTMQHLCKELTNDAAQELYRKPANL